MLPSKPVVPLSAAAIEAAHDYGIDFTWPGIEPVEVGTCINFNALLSAEQQPYQHCFGTELYPSLEEKAAYLFFHLTTSHIFENGNKRTAVLALDAFLLLNEHMLSLTNDEIRDLAQSVAEAGEHGERPQQVLDRVRDVVRTYLVSFTALSTKADLLAEIQVRRNMWQNLTLNQVGTRLHQSGG